MRFSRFICLPAQAMFHMIWKAINGEFFLATEEPKRQFLDRLFKFFFRANGSVLVYAFVVMSNHVHTAAELLGDHDPLSCWLRSSFSSFGLWLNRRLGRYGPVAKDRFKTLVVQDQDSLMRLMFYLDWNPVKAGLCRHPSEWKYSSYRYYAYGEVNKWTEHLTPPKWYIALGKTECDRQRKYRILCDKYYNDQNSLSETTADNTYLIGDPETSKRRSALMQFVAGLIRKNPSARRSLATTTLGFLSPRAWESGTYREDEAFAALQRCIQPSLDGEGNESIYLHGPSS